MKKHKLLIMAVVFCVIFCFGCSKSDEPAVVVWLLDDQAKEALEDADVTIPSVLVGAEIEQLEAEQETEVSQTDNGNGTVTYSLESEQIAEVLDSIALSIADSIQTILDDNDYYPDVVSITPSEDYSSFTIALEDGQMNIYESMLVMSFYTVGNRYQIYRGTPQSDAVTTVIYINAADGAIISENDSTSMETFSSQ